MSSFMKINLAQIGSIVAAVGTLCLWTGCSPTRAPVNSRPELKPSDNTPTFVESSETLRETLTEAEQIRETSADLLSTEQIPLLPVASAPEPTFSETTVQPPVAPETNPVATAQVAPISDHIAPPEVILPLLNSPVKPPKKKSEKRHLLTPQQQLETSTAALSQKQNSQSGWSFLWTFNLPRRTKKLLNEGKVQEALWVAQDEGIDQNTLQRFKWRLQQTLLSRNFSVTHPELGGASQKSVLQFKNGIQGIFKPDGGTTLAGSLRSIDRSRSRKLGIYAADAHSEVAAYALDQLYGLNIVPMTFLKEVDGVVGSVQYRIKEFEPGLYPKKMNTFANMMILDYLAGNSDRHGGNWLYLRSLDRIVAIDHGLSFRNRDGACIIGDYFFGLFGRTDQPCISDNPDDDSPVSDDETITAYENSGAMPLNLEWLGVSVRTKIIHTHDIEVRSALAQLVQPIYLDKLIHRLHRLQKFLTNPNHY